MTGARPAPAGLGSDFRKLLLGAASSNLGDGIRLAALPLLAVGLTDEPLLISGLTAATFLPAVVFGPLGGALIDRSPRRRLLATTQYLRAAASVAFVVLLLTDSADVRALYLLATVLGLGEIVVDSGSQAAIPALVPPGLLERANARMISAQVVLDQLVGSALGGLLHTLAPVLPYLVDATTFLVGGAAISAIDDPLRPDREGAGRGDREAPSAEADPVQRPRDAAGRGSVRDDIREGFAFLAGHALLRRLAVALSLANLAAATAGSVLVLLVVDELGAAEAVFGFVLAGGALGGLLGSAVAERIVRRLGRAVALVGASLLLLLGVVAAGLAPSPLLLSLAVAVQGFAVTVSNVPGRAVRQEVTPQALLGRVIASFRVLGYAGVPLGALVGGLITDVGTARAAHLTAAAIMLVAATAMARAVRELPGPAVGPLH